MAPAHRPQIRPHKPQAGRVPDALDVVHYLGPVTAAFDAALWIFGDEAVS